MARPVLIPSIDPSLPLLEVGHQRHPVEAGPRNASHHLHHCTVIDPAVATHINALVETAALQGPQSLKDAMLDHSASLGIGLDEWLTIAAKSNDDRPRLAPADSDSATRIIRLRGSDLAAYLARQITREEALRRIEVRVF